MKKALSFIFATLVCLVLAQIMAGAKGIEFANADNPGEKVLIGQFVSKENKITIVDVMSVYCPGCVQVSPVLDRLAEKNPDFKIVRLNINRRNVKNRIDFDSPLAKWCGVNATPHFILFGKDRKRIAETGKAGNPLPIIHEWFVENDISWRGWF